MQPSLEQPPARARPADLYRVARAAWLADGVLLVACAPATAATPGGMPSASAPVVRARGGPRGGADAVVAFPWADRELIVRAGDLAVLVTGDAVGAELTSLREFLREQVAPWDASDRAALVAMLVGVAAELCACASVSEGLHTVREAVRERRPLSVAAELTERGLEIHCLHRVDEHAFYVAGRFWEHAAPVTSLVAVAPRANG